MNGKNITVILLKVWKFLNKWNLFVSYGCVQQIKTPQAGKGSGHGHLQYSTVQYSTVQYIPFLKAVFRWRAIIFCSHRYWYLQKCDGTTVGLGYWKQIWIVPAYLPHGR